MKILVYGAGVIGCIYAARLYETGVDITLLAHGDRYESLKQNGVILNQVLTNHSNTFKIPLTQKLETHDFYDLIFVAVRFEQLGSVIPTLEQNTECPAIMFMSNNPGDMEHLAAHFPFKKIILGFPGVGGTFNEEHIDYVQIKEQKTTIGDADSSISSLTKSLKRIIEQAGFKVDLNKNMQSWLNIHAVFMTCVSASIIKENGNSVQLGKNKRSVKIMVKSINEGFKACKILGMPIVPANLKTIFMIMPQWLSVRYWQKALQGQTGTLAMAPHANTAKPEMQLLSQVVLDLVHSASVDTPTLDKLLSTFIHSK